MTAPHGKATERPWAVIQEDDRTYIESGFGKGGDIVTVARLVEGLPEHEVAANASLIVAAVNERPALLARVERLDLDMAAVRRLAASVFNERGHNAKEVCGDILRLCDRAALAAGAEGRESK